MGVIQKQGIQTSVLSYLGVALGYINVVLLFPKIFLPEEFGLTRVLVAVVGIAARFALVGTSNSVIRFFPKFKDKSKTAQGLLKLTLQTILVGLLVVVLALIVGKPWVVEHYQEKSNLFVQFYQLLFPFLVFEVVFQFITSYLRAMYHTVISIFYREVFLRLCSTFLIGCFYLGWLDFNQFMLLFVGQYGLMMVGLLVFLVSKVKPKKHSGSVSLPKAERSEVVKYGVLTFLSGVGGVLAVNIDVIMIGSMVGLDQIAFYTVAVYIVAVIRIPRNALSNIAMPVVAEAWKKEDMSEIEAIYSKTSINQLVIGVLLFVGIWANQHNLFQLLPAEYESGKWVLFYVGLARVIEVSFGIGSGIVTLSKWYKVDVYANVVFLAVAIATNFIFIPIYGIEGAAIATGISLLVLNLIRYVFLKIKWGLNPFGWKSLATVLLGLSCYFISLLLSVQANFVIDICLRSGIILLAFVPIMLLLNLSEDLNKLLRSFLPFSKD